MATLDELIVEMRRVRQSQEVGNDEARKQAEMERKLLGQTEKQYEAMLQQRTYLLLAMGLAPRNSSSGKSLLLIVP